MRENQDGLTLVEMMVALMITGVILAAMASVAVTSMQAVQSSERVVHSTQLGNEVLEAHLATPYDILGLYQTEATDAWGGTTFEGEDLVIFPDPAERDDRVPHPNPPTTERSGIEYEVEVAITWVDDPATSEAQDYKRITVLLSWQHRGEARDARVEAVRSPDPDDQPLTVTIEPDVLRLRDDPAGAVDGDFEVRVVATEPQSSVKVHFVNREGETRTRDLTAVDQHDTVWRRVFDDSADHRRFANGGTLFEIVGTSAAAEQTRTTIGRALFLHDLRIDADRVETTPNQVHVHADDGVCEGLELDVDVVGATMSDPLFLVLGGDEENAQSFTAEDRLTDGTYYHLDLPADVLDPHVAHGDDELAFVLDMQRALDPDDIEGARLQRTVTMTVISLAGGESCPE